MLWVNGRSQLLAVLLHAMPSDVYGDFGPHSLLEIEMVKVGRVGHKTTAGHIPVFIGRPSVLGNPFLMRGEQDREFVVQAYRKYLWDCKKENNDVWQEVERLAKMVKDGKKIELKCFCSPKKCHGDVIAKAIEYINSGE